MRNLLITGILMLVVGLGIGYLIGNQNSSSKEKFTFEEDNFFTFNFENFKVASRHTDTIKYEKAKLLAKNFEDRLDSTKGSEDFALIKWPRKLHGWVLDAKKVEEILIRNNGGTTVCNNIYVELGYNKVDGTTTLIFTGLNDAYDQDGKPYDRRIYRKKDSDIWGKVINQTVLGAEDDNILEYVDPCTPRCPK
jgi:hypothetical protein